MPKAELPHNEEQRLSALRGYDLLDSPDEQIYDDIVYLTSQIMQVPTAFVSLVDIDRQWFKAKYGLDACETSRDVAFCAHAILTPEEPLIVLDTLKDKRFLDNDLVLSAPHIRFYCGVPLVAKNGDVLGTLCVLDYEVRDFVSEAQMNAMKALARQVVAHMEYRLAQQLSYSLWHDSDEALWEYNVLDHSLNVSPSFEKMLGYENDDIFKTIKDMFLVIHADDVIMAKSAMQQYIANSEGQYSYKVRLKHKDGQWLWGHIKGSAIHNVHGQVIKVSGILVDITEDIAKDKSLIQEENLRKNFIEASYDGYWDCNLKTGKSLVSKRFLGILGYNSHEISPTGLNLYNLILPRERYKVLRLLKKHIASNCSVPFKQEISFLAENKKRVILLCRGRVIEWDGDTPKRMIGTATDVTESKKMNEQQIRLNKELMATNEELERFAYMASHDLQEPLRMVNSFTQLLEKKYGGQLDQKAHHYMDVIRSSAGRMQDMIVDLLEYARADAQVTMDQISLDNVLHSALERLKTAREQSSAVITYDVLPSVWGHKTHLISAFQNILSNAIKYQPKDQTPRIDISFRETDSATEIYIKDNGIGMKKEYCHKIFEPFKRLHGKTEYSGTGMGLAICRKIMQKIHGDIYVDSVLGQGTEFTLYFSKFIPCHGLGCVHSEIDCAEQFLCHSYQKQRKQA